MPERNAVVATALECAPNEHLTAFEDDRLVSKKILVLIVESNLPTKLMDHRFNEMPGLVVATANNGDAALDMVNMADPNLVVADHE